jgi:hypothetical protein
MRGIIIVTDDYVIVAVQNGTAQIIQKIWETTLNALVAT